MSMIEVKTAELIGPALDWATFCAVFSGMQPTIHKVESVTIERKPFIKPITFPRAVYLTYSGAYGAELDWSPSSSWEQGGPLIERFGCDLSCIAPGNRWEANCWGCDLPTPGLHLHEAETPLVAACRAIVAANLGDVVSVPAELVQQLVECDHCPTSGGCVGVCMKARQPIEG